MTGVHLAQFLELHEAELVEFLIERFGEEYPDSESSMMASSELDAWSRMEIVEFCRVLRGGEPEIRPHDVYEGDTGQNVDEVIQPITTYVEGRLFIARTMADFIWRHMDQPIQAKKDVFAVLDAATLKMVRANLLSFATTELPDGCLMRTWNFSSRVARTRRSLRPAHAGGESEAKKPLLTQRESEIAQLVAAGRTNGEIAAQLGLSQSTVKNRLVRIYDKLGVNTRAELAAWMAREN